MAANVVGLAIGFSKNIVVDIGFCLQGKEYQFSQKSIFALIWAHGNPNYTKMAQFTLKTITTSPEIATVGNEEHELPEVLMGGCTCVNVDTTIAKKLWQLTGKLLTIYICNVHVLSHLLLIYVCKLHWKKLWQLTGGREVSKLPIRLQSYTRYSYSSYGVMYGTRPVRTITVAQWKERARATREVEYFQKTQ